MALDLSFKASITEKNLTAQYSFRSPAAHGACYIYNNIIAQGYRYIISMGLCQPREHVKFSHSIEIFAIYGISGRGEADLLTGFLILAFSHSIGLFYL